MGSRRCGWGPTACKQVLARALESDRDRRWPDAGAFADALAAVALEDRPANGNGSPGDTTPAGHTLRDTGSSGSTRTTPIPDKPARPPRAPKPKRRKRIQLFGLLTIVLLMLGGGAVVTIASIARNDDQYFVGEGGDGEIAIFQGSRGSLLGFPLNTQVQGSCDPAVPTCDKIYVGDLTRPGQDTVRSGPRTFGDIAAARGFIQDLRATYRLPTCDLLSRQQDIGSGAAGPPKPGVNCREPRG